MLTEDQLFFISEAEQFEAEIKGILEGAEDGYIDEIIEILYGGHSFEDCELFINGECFRRIFAIMALARIGLSRLTESKFVTEEESE